MIWGLLIKGEFQCPIPGPPGSDSLGMNLGISILNKIQCDSYLLQGLKIFHLGWSDSSPQKRLKISVTSYFPLCDSLQLGQDSDLPISHDFSLKPLRTNFTPFPEGLKWDKRTWLRNKQKYHPKSPSAPLLSPLHIEKQLQFLPSLCWWREEPMWSGDWLMYRVSIER